MTTPLQINAEKGDPGLDADVLAWQKAVASGYQGTLEAYRVLQGQIESVKESVIDALVDDVAALERGDTVLSNKLRQLSVAEAVSVEEPFEDGEVVSLAGYRNKGDGYFETAVFSSTSTAPVDGLLVFLADGGRLLLLDKSQPVDLRWLDLSQDGDVTTLLTNLAANAGDDLTLDFSAAPDRLYCDFVSFSVENFQMIGECTIKQPDTATQQTVIRIDKPNNVFLGPGITFEGSDDQSRSFTSSNEGIVIINGNARLKTGGAIIVHSNFRNTTSSGIVVLNALVRDEWDLVEIRGDHYDTGITSNCCVNRLIMDVSLADPLGKGDTGSELNKARGISFGRCTGTFDLRIALKYGFSTVFGFVIPDAVGVVEIKAFRYGYAETGAALPHPGSSFQIFKTDTAGDKSALTANVETIDDAGRPLKVSFEASPGPNNNNNMRVVGNSIIAEMSSLQDDGVANYQNFGNSLLPGSLCDLATTGFVSLLSGSTVNKLATVSSNILTPSQISQGSIVKNCQVIESVKIEEGASVYFRNCRLPAEWEFLNSATVVKTKTILGFRNCDFRGAEFLPSSFDDFLFGFEGTNFGLDPSNIPPENIPYLHLDGVSHPHNDGDLISANDEIVRKIANPVSGSDGQFRRYSGSSSNALAGDAVTVISSVDLQYVQGDLTFPTVNTTDRNGAYAADLGVDEGAIEIVFEFINGGSPEAGVSGRFNSDFAQAWARVDIPSSELRLTLGFLLNAPAVTVDLPTSAYGAALAYGATYTLRLEIDDTEFRVYLDGILLITEPSTYNVGETKWAYKSWQKTGDNAVGPLVKSLTVAPIKNSTSANAATVTAERRGTVS